MKSLRRPLSPPSFTTLTSTVWRAAFGAAVTSIHASVAFAPGSASSFPCSDS
jgi:hypothetical protein